MDENLEPSRKKRKGDSEEEEEGRVVTGELVVYDKHSRCLLTEGEYELVMAESEGKSRKSPSKTASWEIIDVASVINIVMLISLCSHLCTLHLA